MLSEFFWHHSFWQNLCLVEEQLGNLTTDDPSVIETAIGNYGDKIYPDQTSLIQRYFVFLLVGYNQVNFLKRFAL